MLGASTTNKQAGTIKDAAPMTRETAGWFQVNLDNSYREAQKLYDEALKLGVPKELARVHLPVGRYSRMRASANLRNWLGFLTLRQADNAQYEIRVFADAVAGFVAEHFPRTFNLFEEGK